MPESESFDVFYARTVWNVTSQMHALAGEDSAADHAIREAYARAYQQWYEIADNPDTEGWVLAAAKEAYERRRPEAAARPVTTAATGHDSLSWPGLYRPRTPAGTPADPASTIGGPLVGMAAAPTFGGPAGPAVGMAGTPADENYGRPAAAGVGVVPGLPASITAALPGAGQGVPPAPPGFRRDPGRMPRPGSRGRLVALTTAIALIAAGAVIYLTTVGNPSRHTAQHNTATQHHGPVMLGAGKIGGLSAIPWSLVGQVPGWTLAEVSTAPAGTSQPAAVAIYLVDPEGGRYQIQNVSSASGATPQLLAWSGDEQKALLAVPGSSGAGPTYELLYTMTGNITTLPLPANTTAVGFSRPDGVDIVAVRETSDAFKLQRYDLQGQLQGTIGTLPRKPGSPDWAPGCVTACGALSSPDGTTDVWGVAGDEMQLVGNSLPAKVIARLKVPGADSCVPLSWWDTSTVLASCGVTGQPSAGQLWLLPADGSTPTEVTQTSGSPSGNGNLVGAWPAAGTTYVSVTNSEQCQGATNPPGGLAVVPVSSESLQSPITVQGATNNRTSIVSASGGKLLVLAQTGCPGTSSLLWLNPSTGATTPVLTAPAGQVGVLAAVPYGLGATATNGQ
jgi:hypothetical protein